MTRARLALPIAAAFLACGAPRAPTGDELIEAAPGGEAADARPRLVALVHVPSFRAEYLARFEPLLGEAGFRRLMTEGAWTDAARVEHTVTRRGPGLASLATGLLPGRAGIPSSGWFDRERRRSRSAVTDEQSFTRGSDPEILPREVSPRNLERPTLGDLLQEQLGEDAVVAAFGWYDEGALLLGGRESDASVWIDQDTGTWVTSSRVAHRLPEFAVAENAAGAIHRYRGAVWERTFDDAVGERYASPDDDPDEPPYAGMPHFPYEVPELVMVRNKVRKVIDGTPFADRSVLDCVRAGTTALRMGEDDVTDLLAVDLASLGDVGRDYGPDSQEVLGTVLELDARLAELFALLDERAGPGRWTFVLASGEGLARLPEKTGGRRLRTQEIQVPVELALRAAFPQHVITTSRSWTIGLGGPWVFLDHGVVEAAGVDLAEARRVAAEAAAGVDGVGETWTPETLASSDDPARRRWAEDLHPERSGDVLVLLEEGSVLDAGVGTAPGSHHAYDRDVPLFLLGAGIRAGRLASPAGPVDVVPTLLALLGLDAPDDLDGRVLEEALDAL